MTSPRSRFVPHPSRYDYALDVPAGKIGGTTSVNKFGRNPDIDTATDPEDIWDGGGIWMGGLATILPPSAQVYQISSSDANDTTAGTGARTLTIEGLSAGEALQSENINMNGTSDVATSNTYTIIHRMYVTTVGSNNFNAGDITANTATAKAGEVMAQISVGNNQSLMAIYKVPVAKTAFITNYYASANPKSGASPDLLIGLWVNSAGPWQLKHVNGVYAGGGSYLKHPFNPYMTVAATEIIKLQVIETSANDSDVSGGFDLILVDN